MITKTVLKAISALALFVLASSFPSHGWSGPLSTEIYDDYFARFWGRYISQHDWNWGKAICYQESLLEPGAVSHAGAKGLCQFMDPTLRDCDQSLNFRGRVDPFDPYVSITCNAWYMSRLIRIWRAPRPKLERLYLAQASYNAGAKNIIDAQGLCGEVPFWKQIAPCLVQVTGRHSAETITYVERIGKWYVRLADSRNHGTSIQRPAMECRTSDRQSP